MKSIKSNYRKDQIESYTRIGSPVQTKADSKFTNPNPVQNNHINNRKTKINTGSKLKNMIKKYEYATKYVFRERGVTMKMLSRGGREMADKPL